MPPIVNFRTARENCPECGKKLKVQKTDTKIIYSLHIGKVIAHQTFLHCDSCTCSDVYFSEELNNLVPKHCNFSYDVLVYVGRAVFQRYRTGYEVIQELAELNVPISNSEVNYLAQKFIVYLAVAHRNISDKIRDCMWMKGGYILHIDGTSDGGSPHLISTLDELSQFVLANIKIPSENATQIVVLLQEIKDKYGTPSAIVTDMGKAMLGAIAEIFPEVLVYICHFHFLRDIGKDLLEKPYAIIRNNLKKYSISKQLRYRLRQYSKTNLQELDAKLDEIIYTQEIHQELDETKARALCYTLIAYALDGKNQGAGFGFPFDRTHLVFYQRLCAIYNTLENIGQDCIIDSKARKIHQALSNDLQALIQDLEVREAAESLKQKTEVFDNLREAMQIALTDSKKGLNDNGTEVNIKTIEHKIKEFKNRLTGKETYKNDKDYQKMVKQIDKYWDKLFADPITLNTPTETITVQPQRTNNLMEQFFRGFKRAYRRTSGNNSMSKKLQSMIADTPLVKNLDNQEYIEILLDGKKSLEEVFAEIECRIIQEEIKKANEKEFKIPPKIRKIIKTENVPVLFQNLSG